MLAFLDMAKEALRLLREAVAEQRATRERLEELRDLLLRERIR